MRVGTAATRGNLGGLLDARHAEAVWSGKGVGETVVAVLGRSGRLAVCGLAKADFRREAVDFFLTTARL